MSERVRTALAQVVDGHALTEQDAYDVMISIMAGEATSAQIAGLLMALRMRGETVEEIVGFARAMRSQVVTVKATAGAIDTCGTGGDGSGSFNISTAAAIVAAAAGAVVAKHGNRAVTSRSGSSDVLDVLGIRTDHDAPSASRAMASSGFAFLFAPAFHPAMRHAALTRREIGIRTVFNLLGPLSNPSGTRRQVVGVGSPAAAPLVAEALRRLGSHRAFVVHGAGIDELPLDGSGVAYEVTPERVVRHNIVAADFGLPLASTSALAGGTPADNARIVEAVLRGARGPRQDVVVLNAGIALLAAGLAPDHRGGIDLARAAIGDGAAGDLLDTLRAERHAHEQAKLR